MVVAQCFVTACSGCPGGSVHSWLVGVRFGPLSKKRAVTLDNTRLLVSPRMCMSGDSRSMLFCSSEMPSACCTFRICSFPFRDHDHVKPHGLYQSTTRQSRHQCAKRETGDQFRSSQVDSGMSSQHSCKSPTVPKFSVGNVVSRFFSVLIFLLLGSFSGRTRLRP